MTAEWDTEQERGLQRRWRPVTAINHHTYSTAPSAPQTFRQSHNVFEIKQCILYFILNMQVNPFLLYLFLNVHVWGLNLVSIYQEINLLCKFNLNVPSVLPIKSKPKSGSLKAKWLVLYFVIFISILTIHNFMVSCILFITLASVTHLWATEDFFLDICKALFRSE